MKKQKKKYSRPRKPFDRLRIEEENTLRDKYGLKSKREIWKVDSAIKRIRDRAKRLITLSEGEKKEFVERFRKKGFNVNTITDILALNKEDLLKRRLQTLVFNKGFANTPKQARQFIVHKHVTIGSQKINIPSYQVSSEEEALIKLNIVLKNKDQKSDIEKISEGFEEAKQEDE